MEASFQTRTNGMRIPSLPFLVLVVSLLVVILWFQPAQSVLEPPFMMGFSSKILNFQFNRGELDRADPSQMIYKSQKGKMILRKGNPLEIPPPYPSSNSPTSKAPQVHAVFDLPSPMAQDQRCLLEFVSDPISIMNSDDRTICSLTYKLRSYMNSLVDGTGQNFIDKYFVENGLSLSSGRNVVQQTLKVTFSFPPEKAMTALRVLLKFLSSGNAKGSVGPWAYGLEVDLLNAMIQFIDENVRAPEESKLIVFFLFQYLSREKCNGIDSNSPLSKMVVLKTNLYQLIRFRPAAVAPILKNQPPYMAMSNLFKQFEQRVSREQFYSGRINPCMSRGPRLPFSMQDYIDTVFKESGRDKWADLPEAMGNSFGKFTIDKTNPSVIFTLNLFNESVYSKTPQNVRDQAAIIPSLFHIARQVFKNSNMNDMKPMICSDNGLQVLTPSSVVSVGENAGPQSQPPNVSKIREDRREMNNIVKEKRAERRELVDKTKSGSSSAKTLSNDNFQPLTISTPNRAIPSDIGLIREERRKIRVTRRINRENRRMAEAKQGLGKKPTPKQLKREAIRLAREKKRLAREEERDVAIGIEPVSVNEISQMIHSKKKKKNQQVQPSKKKRQPRHPVDPTEEHATDSAPTSHKSTTRKKKPVHVRIKLRI